MSFSETLNYIKINNFSYAFLCNNDGLTYDEGQENYDSEHETQSISIMSHHITAVLRHRKSDQTHIKHSNV